MMRFVFLISLFILSGFLSYAQDSSSRMLEDAVRSLKDSGTIIYVDSSYNFSGLIKNISQRRVLTGKNENTKVTFSLTKAEVRFLDKEFHKYPPFVWPSGMFNNSLLVTYDSASSIRLKMMKEQNRMSYKAFFLFSRIVYFRNNSFAAFRLAELYGISAGYDYLFFYQRINGEWRKYMKIYVGAW